jgi:hypothetical protein
VRERDQALGGRGSWAERGRAVQERRLERVFLVVEQGLRECALVGEAAVDRADADAGRGRDLVQCEAVDASGREQVRRGGQDLAPVACGVGAFHDARA